MKKYVSPHKALIKGDRMVTIPFLLLMLFMIAFTVYIGIITNSVALGVSLMILSFVLPILLYQHQKVQWKIWAFENVRSLEELFTTKTSSLLLSGNNPIEEKTILSYKKDKARIAKIVFNRKENKTYDLEVEDSFLPAETEISYSIKYYSFFLAVGIGLGYLTTIIPTDIGDAIFGKIVCGLVSIVFIQWSIRRLLDRHFLIKINDKGIETRKTGVSKWCDIEEMTVYSKRNNQGGTRTQEKSLKIRLQHKSKPKVLKFDINTLNISLIDLDETIKIYKLRNKKKITAPNRLE